MKSCVQMIILLCLLSPAVGAAQHIIQLKNGRRIITDRYWISDDRIMIDQYGGVVGIPQDDVRAVDEISKTKEYLEVEYADPQESAVPEHTAKKERNTAPQPAVPERELRDQDGKIDVQLYQQKKQQLLTSIAENLQKRREAYKSRNEADKAQASKAMLEAATELSALREALQTANKGVLPDWWEQ